MLIKRKSRKYKQKQGFSLIEVLVAIAVIAIAMATLGYLITALRNTAKSDESTAAANFSRAYIDVLRSRWQIPNEYNRGGAYNRSGANTSSHVILPLTDPPALFDEYSILVENLDIQDSPPTVIASKTFTYKRGTTQTAKYAPPEFDKDILRRVTITMKGRDGKDGKNPAPFVTEIVAPTVTR